MLNDFEKADIERDAVKERNILEDLVLGYTRYLQGVKYAGDPGSVDELIARARRYRDARVAEIDADVEKKLKAENGEFDPEAVSREYIENKLSSEDTSFYREYFDELCADWGYPDLYSLVRVMSFDKVMELRPHMSGSCVEVLRDIYAEVSYYFGDGEEK